MNAGIGLGLRRGYNLTAMGLCRPQLRLLLEEASRRPFSGSVLQLGRNFVFFDDAELTRWAAAHEVELTPVGDPTQPLEPSLARRGCLDDRTLFRRLGFDEVRSLDVDPGAGTDVVHDLNRPVPDDVGPYDVVLESGTIQHVFHLPQVLANVHRLTRAGGRAIHCMAPSNNHVDHGFYMFSPTLFADFYHANGWTLERAALCEFQSFWVDGVLECGPTKIYDYEPGLLDHLSYGRIGNRQLAIFVVATRHGESTGDVAPQQFAYRQLWQRPDEERSAFLDSGETPSRLPLPLLRRWKRLTERVRRFGPKRLPRPSKIY